MGKTKLSAQVVVPIQPRLDISPEAPVAAPLKYCHLLHLPLKDLRCWIADGRFVYSVINIKTAILSQSVLLGVSLVNRLSCFKSSPPLRPAAVPSRLSSSFSSQAPPLPRWLLTCFFSVLSRTLSCPVPSVHQQRDRQDLPRPSRELVTLQHPSSSLAALGDSIPKRWVIS